MPASISLSRALLFALSLHVLTGCGLVAECDVGGGEIRLTPLTFGDVAPLLLLGTLCVLLLVQAPLLTWWRARRERRSLFTAALSWCGFTTGLSLLPLCPALYSDTFYPRLGGPFNFGHAVWAFLDETCPLMLVGILLVVLVTLCRWIWLHRKKA